MNKGFTGDLRSLVAKIVGVPVNRGRGDPRPWPWTG